MHVYKLNLVEVVPCRREVVDPHPSITSEQRRRLRAEHEGRDYAEEDKRLAIPIEKHPNDADKGERRGQGDDLPRRMRSQSVGVPGSLYRRQPFYSFPVVDRPGNAAQQDEQARREQNRAFREFVERIEEIFVK